MRDAEDVAGSPASDGATSADGLRLAGLALSRTTLDRAADRRRDPQWWDAVLADPETRYLPLADGRFPVRRGDGAVRLDWSGRPGNGNGDAHLHGEAYLLGVDQSDHAHVAVAVREAEHSWVNLREVGDELNDLDAGAATHATALLAWHAAEPFSPASGEPTRVAAAGSVRVDPQGNESFPRTDPAMIVLVHDGDLHDPGSRALLGHQRLWPAGRFSCLAGFVEAGESLEQAVAREVAEESAVVVAEIRYAGSQPWPFPRSLMLGFTARATSVATRPDGDEIGELRWFTRDALRAAVDDGTVRLPGRVSIARRLIEGWYGDQLPGDW